MLLCPRCKEHNESVLCKCLSCGYPLKKSKKKPGFLSVNTTLLNDEETGEEEVVEHETMDNDFVSSTKPEESIDGDHNVANKEVNNNTEKQPVLYCTNCYSLDLDLVNREKMSNGTTFALGTCRNCGKKGLYKISS